jgi:hypothetical protein
MRYLYYMNPIYPVLRAVDVEVTKLLKKKKRNSAKN